MAAEEYSAGPDEEQSPRSQPPRRGRGWRLAVGIGLVLVGAGGGLVAQTVQATPSPRPVGANAPVNEGAADPSRIDAHNSPTLVRNPVDPAELVVGNRVDPPRLSCALHTSSDGGTTWQQQRLPVPEGAGDHCYAPDVAFGADGTLYVAYSTLAGRGNRPHAVWIVTSGDGGRTLSEPNAALDALAFQVRLTVDRDAGRLLLTWLQAEDTATLSFPEAGYPIQAAHSDDGGQTWSDPVQVNDPDRARVVAPSPALGPDGELYVAYLDLGDDRLDYHGAHEGRGGPPYDGTWELVVARSADGGTAWTETVADSEVVPTERFLVFLPPYPSVAVDDSSGTVYVAFHDGRRGDADVWLWASGDGGTTWRDPVRVNETQTGDGTTQRLPQLATAPDGRLDVVYYDRRADPDDVRNEVSLQSSADGGRRFSERVALSEERFDARIGFGSERDMPDLGSRLALLSTDTHALAVWTDTRAGTRASNKQDLTRQLVTFGPGPYLPAGLRGGLWYGGQAVSVVGLALLLWAALSKPLARRRSAHG